MGIPWFLKPELLLHAEMLDRQEELSRASDDAHARDRAQDREIAALQSQIRDLQQQLLALETLLSEKGILLPRPAAEAPLPQGGAAVFPARTRETVTCPRCGGRQRGDRDLCCFCGELFRYEDE